MFQAEEDRGLGMVSEWEMFANPSATEAKP